MTVDNVAAARVQQDSMRKSRIDLVWVSIINAIITVLNSVVWLLVARHLPVHDYGQLSYFTNIFGVLRLLAALGMSSQVLIEMARARGQGLPLPTRFYPLFYVRLFTLAAITVLVVGFGLARQDPLLRLAGLMAALALINDFAVGTLQGLARVRQVLCVLVIQPILFALAVVFIILTNSPVHQIYYAYLLAFTPAIIVAFGWTIGAVGLPKQLNIDWSTVRDSLHFAGGMYVMAIVGTLFTSYATLRLGATARFYDAALITIPLNLIFTPGALANIAMATVYFPRLGEMHARKDTVAAQAWFNLFYKMVSAATVLVSIVLLLYPRVILGLLYGSRYQDSAVLLSLLAPAVYIYTTQTVLTFSMVAQGRVRDAVPGTALPVVVLILVLAIAPESSGVLIWYAAAHSVTATLGLVWQFSVIGYKRRSSLEQTGKHLLIAFTLFGVGRLIVLDSPANIPAAVVALGIAAVLYSAIVIREILQ